MRVYETGRALVTAPTEELVSRALAISHLREQPDTDQADYIDHLIVSAREHVEALAWRAFCQQTWDVWFACFPQCEIELPLAPLRSVTSISYTDTAGDTQTMSASDYIVDTSCEPGIIVPAYGTVWPTTRADVPQAVKVRFVAGYASASLVPRRYTQAILLTLGHWYANRESVVTDTNVIEIPQTVHDLLAVDSMRKLVA